MTNKSLAMGAIYNGVVEHDRKRDVCHRFRVSLALWYIDIDGVRDLSRLRPWYGRSAWSPLTFRREDYFPGRKSLRDTILDLVERSLGIRPAGSIHLLTQLRSFGFVFNPVTFAYCQDANGEVAAIVAEITNTPWGERHCYVVDQRFRATNTFAKTFHVSPFQPMAQDYVWRFSSPRERLRVSMANRSADGVDFTARMRLRRHPLTAAGAARVVLTRPLQALMVVMRIYIEAVRLWRKGAPFYTHPSKRASAVPS